MNDSFHYLCSGNKGCCSPRLSASALLYGEGKQPHHCHPGERWLRGAGHGGVTPPRLHPSMQSVHHQQGWISRITAGRWCGPSLHSKALPCCQGAPNPPPPGEHWPLRTRGRWGWSGFVISKCTFLLLTRCCGVIWISGSHCCHLGWTWRILRWKCLNLGLQAVVVITTSQHCYRKATVLKEVMITIAKPNTCCLERPEFQLKQAERVLQAAGSAVGSLELSACWITAHPSLWLWVHSQLCARYGVSGRWGNSCCCVESCQRCSTNNCINKTISKSS